ncbi:MAG: site-2 protease family protein [Candidatus Marsarchaeota archaeon]|jgi:Zn-dependent protease
MSWGRGPRWGADWGNVGPFSVQEIINIVIAWLVLGLAFSNSFSAAAVALSLLTWGLAFLVHELSHKFAARHYGRWAEFRLWTWGVLLALFLALIRSPILFAAPGAVYIAQSYGWDYLRVKKENGVISLAGPAANAALAGVSFLAFAVGLAPSFAFTLFWVNVWLGAFNMIPIPPLDGYKVFTWSKTYWALLTVVLFAAVVWVLA